MEGKIISSRRNPHTQRNKNTEIFIYFCSHRQSEFYLTFLLLSMHSFPKMRYKITSVPFEQKKYSFSALCIKKKEHGGDTLLGTHTHTHTLEGPVHLGFI